MSAVPNRQSDDGAARDDPRRRAYERGRAILRERRGVIASLTPEQVDEARRYRGSETVGRCEQPDATAE